MNVWKLVDKIKSGLVTYSPELLQYISAGTQKFSLLEEFQM